MKHGFLDEHLRIWKTRFMADPRIISSYDVSLPNEDQMKELMQYFSKQQIDNLHGHLPENNKYPPKEGTNYPPTLMDWAQHNGITLAKNNMSTSKKVQAAMLSLLLSIRTSMDSSVVQRSNRDTQIVSPMAIRYNSASTENALQNRKEYFVVNLGRECKTTSNSAKSEIHFKSVKVGVNQVMKDSNTLLDLKEKYGKYFKKKAAENELQVQVISASGYMRCYDEDDFNNVSLKAMVDECDFDVYKSQVELTIKEYQGEGFF